MNKRPVSTRLSTLEESRLYELIARHPFTPFDELCEKADVDFGAAYIHCYLRMPDGSPVLECFEISMETLHKKLRLKALILKKEEDELQRQIFKDYEIRD